MAKLIGSIPVSEFKGALVGMVIGDGHLAVDKRDNGNSSMEVWGTNMDYMMFKKSILDNLTETTVTEYPAKEKYWARNDKSYMSKPRIRLRSKRHPVYSKLREHLYYDNRRTIDDFSLKTLTPMGLAITYMDDGSYNISNGAMVIYTNAYNRLEHECIVRALAKRFGIQCSINSSRGLLSLYVKKKSQDDFINLIDPYIIESMRHKMPNDERPLTRSKR